MPRSLLPMLMVGLVAVAAHAQDRNQGARVSVVELQRPAGDRPATTPAASRTRAALRAAASAKAHEAGERADDLERRLSAATAERPASPRGRLERTALTARLREGYLRARVEQMLSRALGDGRAPPYDEILGFLDREAARAQPAQVAGIRGLRRVFEERQQPGTR